MNHTHHRIGKLAGKHHTHVCTLGQEIEVSQRDRIGVEAQRFAVIGQVRLREALCRSVWNLTAHPMLCQAR